MKKIFFHVLFLTGIAALLFSCEKGDEGNGGVDPLAITIQNRAVNATWEEGDAIGITIYNEDYTEIVGNQFNREYVNSDGGSVFAGSSAANIAYFPQNGNPIRINSYYPYRSDLSSNMLYPVAVTDQTVLQELDLMTAEHLTGFSKDDRDVHIHFYHRMSRLIFNLSTDEDGDYVSLADCNLRIEGLQTGNTYNLYSDEFVGPELGVANIQVPRRTGEAGTYREAIVLPRDAGEGVRFVFTAPNGDYYTAIMADTIAFEGGNQYTFNITLSRVPIVVGATIEPWIDNGPYEYVILPVHYPAGASSGVTVGDVMHVYLQDAEDTTLYTLLRDYTYQEDGRWIPDSEIYWEDINQDPAVLRASIIAQDELNSTQLPDILIADPISVARNYGADLTFNHAASKVIITLDSNDFTAQALNSAVITLPNYETGGYEELGEFIPGTTREDILVDRTDLAASTAIFQPQSVVASDILVKITINGRDYDAYDPNGFTFNAGTAYHLLINVYENQLTVSATVVDWLPDELELDARTVGVAVSGGTNVLDGEVLNVFTGDANSRTLLTSFTYSLANNVFTPQPVVYWESLPDPTTFYGYIQRGTAYNDTQLPDYIVAQPVTVAASNGVPFTLSHATSQVVVQLKSDGTFSDTELAAMNITLPDYITGATMDNGVFTPGSTVSDITVAKNVGENNSAIALIQPQTITAGNTVVRVASSTREYDATHTSNVVYQAGHSYLITVNLSKTAVTISAVVIDWEDGPQINLVAQAIKIGGTLAGTAKEFFTGKTIQVNVLNDSPVRTVDYVYDGTDWNGDPIYWDDYPGQAINMTAIWARTGQPTLSGTTFPWSIATNQNDAAAGYYDNYDLLVARRDLSAPVYVNFQFGHATSKVTVKLIAGDGFMPSDLVGSTVLLNNYLLNGTMDLTDGTLKNFTNSADVTPRTITNGVEYSALVMPQTKAQNSTIVTVTLPDYPDTPFEVTWNQATPLQFYAGRETVIEVKIKKTAIELSATVVNWVEGDTGEVIIQ